MAGVFLEPDDVGPDDAAVVLAALNTAGSAERLAADVELPGEPDIGVRLAARILRRREELGGRFTDLAQVFAVPLIGPARFTDLVVALTGARPGAIAAGVPADVRAELDALRADVAALRAAAGGVVPTLRVRSGGRWLGEPVRLVAGRSDGHAGAPLLVVAVNGRLETMAGGTPVGGAAVEVRTGALGQAELTWLPDAVAALDDGQRAALTARLPDLGDPPTPHDAVAALGRLAAEYLREPARALREAVDALWLSRAPARDRADAPAGSATADAWPLLDAAVTVHALAATGSVQAGAGVLGSAALVLHPRDWLDAFAAALRRRVAQTASLGSQLRAEAGRDRAPAAVGAALQARLGTWLANRPGVLARQVAVEVAEAAVGDILADTADGPASRREALVPILSASARAVGQLPAPVLGALEATGSVVRRDVIDRITQLPKLDLGVVGDLTQRLEAIEGGFRLVDDRVTTALTDVQRLRGQVERTVTVEQLDRALAGKLDNAEATRIERLVNRVGRLEDQVRRPR